MIPVMSKQSEERLINAVTQLAADVDDGNDVTSSAVKAARDYSLNRNFVERMAHAYNTGKQNEQRESSSHALDKFASFEVVDSQKVLKQIYGDQPAEKQAQSVASPFWTDTTSASEIIASIRQQNSESELVRSTVKAAHVVPELPKTIHREKLDQNHRTCKLADEHLQRQTLNDLKIQLRTEKFALATDISRLTSYFKLASVDRQPVEFVEFTAGREFGHAKVASLITAALKPLKLAEKRASDKSAPGYSYASPDFDLQPYSLIARCIKQAEFINELAETIKTAEASVPATPFEYGFKSKAEKLASMLSPRSLMGAAAAGSILSQTIEHDKPKEMTMDNPALAKLSDPDHDQKMKDMSAQYTLQDLMANDEVISSYPSDQVSSAFNEISQLSPHMAGLSAAMRPALRRALQGNSELHEAGQLADLEKTLSAQRAPGK